MASLAEVANAIWERPSLGARLARLGLTPASWLYGAVVARRNARFDTAASRPAALPAISIGNLTVGGTGKTPVAAWCAQQLAMRGAHPAIVLRGVGDDEWRVHGILNPGRPVVVSADRHAGMFVARTRGADCVVLDDAFQHRQAARVADVVLVSADRWNGACRLLPAGPFREPLSALRRADLVVVTVKAASVAQLDDAIGAVRAAAPDVPFGVVRLAPDELRLAVTVGEQTARVRAGGHGAASAPHGSHRARSEGHSPPRPRPELLTHPASWLRGQTVLSVSALGDPVAFEAQVEALGARLVGSRRYPDHHAFTALEAADIARDAAGTAGVICTLKDAVKLGPLWPREAPPLWYLSQSVVVDRGAEAFDRVFSRLLAARAATTPTAG